MLKVVLALSATLALAGCAAAPGVHIGVDVAPATHSAPAVNTAPTGIELPGIGVVSGPLITVGLDPDGSIQVPPVSKPEELAYYAYGPVPGAVGPAVVLGHVNGGGVQGVFAKLHDMHVGDTVVVDRPGGNVLFTVYRSELIPKCDPKVTPGVTCRFPWDSIMAPTTGPELRLLSCDGLLNTKIHSYESNRVVWARLAT